MINLLRLLACLLLLACIAGFQSCSKDKNLSCWVVDHSIPTENKTFRLFYDEDRLLERIDEYENGVISYQHRMTNEGGKFVFEERWLVGVSSGPFLEFFGELDYDAAGRLSTIKSYSEDLTGEFVLQQTITFNYEADRLSSIEYLRNNGFTYTLTEILEYDEENIVKSKTTTFVTFPDTVLLDVLEETFDYDNFTQISYPRISTLSLPNGHHWPGFSKNNVILRQSRRLDADGNVISIESVRRDLTYDDDNRVISSRTNIEENFEYTCVEE